MLGVRFANLAQVLGVPPEQLRALVVDHPGMLTKSSAAVKEAITKARAAGQLAASTGSGEQAKK